VSLMDEKLMSYQVGDKIEIFVLLKAAEVRTAKNNKRYIAFTFEDSSGEMGGMYWDASEQDIETFKAGKVVHLIGKREEYQSKPQIKISQLRTPNVGEPSDPGQFVTRAPMKKSEMVDEINQVMFEITNPTWNRLTRFLINKHQADFFDFPAAKTNHHAFEGGLAFHTISILRLAHSVCNQYPNVNAPLLYAAAILHDLGKTVELSDPITTQYTVAGNLIGHISLIDGELVEACQTLKLDPSSEDVILLRHMILAHHGLLEYGSPVRPQVLEAEILHDLDELDASIMAIQTSLDHTEPGEFSERLFGMDNRRFFEFEGTKNHEQDTKKPEN